MLIQDIVYSCTSCQCSFQIQELYKTHYKSEYHRYNLKRKIINLLPIQYNQYVKQIQNTKTNSSAISDFKCEICNKLFSSPNTYSHHLNSKKHKQARSKIMKKSQEIKTQSRTSSNISIITCNLKENSQKCIFCDENFSQNHLKLHNFPPLKQNCSNIDGLIKHTKSIIQQLKCVFCKLQFSNIEGVKQHMLQVGHSKINLDNFEQFEPYYNWSINQENQSDEDETIDLSKSNQNKKLTLKELQRKRRQRIVMTKIGAKINGRLIGIRMYRKYYKQYFRPIIHIDRTPKSLTTTNLIQKQVCIKV